MEREGPKARRQGPRPWMCPISPHHSTSWLLYLNNWIDNISIPEAAVRIKLDNEAQSFLKTVKDCPRITLLILTNS